MSTCIAFGSPVVNSYAQSSSITSEQEKAIMTSIQPWLHIAVKKSQSGTVWSEIWLSWIPKRERTSPPFQRIFTCLHPINGSGSMTFCTTTGLLKTTILDRLQCWKKNEFWGCSGGILPRSWILKSCTTFPSFDWLLIQPQRTNGLEETEFCASVNCWKLNWTAQQLEETKFRRLAKSETPGLPNTISLGTSLRLLMGHFTTPNGQWLTS
jgi:hypothetical protein